MNFSKKNHELDSNNRNSVSKTKAIIFSFLFILIISSCSKRIDYTPEYMQQTSGRYLYNQDDVIEVFYENKKLFLKWRGAKKIEPVIIDENTFFIVDMYKKLHFVVHPETKKRYLSIYLKTKMI